jgi:curved DNA-binding protein CbpA
MNTEVALEIFNIDVYDFYHNANITNDFIKKRYHTLALQYHPDKNGNTAESKERFQEINEAYSFLSKELGIGNKKGNTTTSASQSFNNNNIRRGNVIAKSIDVDDVILSYK